MKGKEITLLDILNRYCSDNKLDAKSVKHILTSGNKYGSVGDLEAELERREVSCLTREKYDPKERLDSKQRSYLLWARTLHLMVGMPWSEFRIPNDSIYESASIKKEQLNEYKVLKLKYDSSTEESTKKFRDDYWAMTSMALSSMTRDLVVFDYLEKLNFHSPFYLSPYFEAHSQIYDEIEKKLILEGFQYTRFFALPVGFQTDNSIRDSCNNNEYTYTLASVLDHCSFYLFKHICNCLFTFSDKFIDRKTGLYLVTKTSRTYHWGVIDGGNYIISEYYRYDKNNVCKPDIMFIDRLNGENKKLLEIYQEERAGLLRIRPDKNTHNHLIELDNEFEVAINAIYKFANELEQQIRNNNPNKSDNQHIYVKQYQINTEKKWNYYNILKEQAQSSS